MDRPFGVQYRDGLFLLTHEHQHELEHVQEADVEVQRAVIGRLVEPFLITLRGVRDVGALDLLRVIGRQTREDQKSDRRDGEHHRRALQEDVDDHRHDQADHAHDEERTPAGDVTLRGVAVERQTGEGDRCHEEGLNDREAGKDQKDRTDRKTDQGREAEEAELHAGRRGATQQRPPAQGR